MSRPLVTLRHRLTGSTALVYALALGSPTAALAAGLDALQTPQGTTPGRTGVLAISGDGSVGAGFAENDNGDDGAVVWGFGPDPLAVGEFTVSPTTPGVVTSISNNGLHYTLSDSVDDAIGGRSTGLYKLRNNTGTFAGLQEANGISDDGNRVVGRDGGKAAIWAYNLGLVDFDNALSLPDLGGQSSGANALTPDGARAAGFARDAAGTQRAVVWSGQGLGTIQSLDPNSVYGTSLAYAISDDGKTVVGYVSDGTKEMAAVWSGGNYGTITTILPVGAMFSQAKAVNADGSIVGGTFETQPQATFARAFLYADGKVGDLNVLLSDAGVDMTGIVLKEVTGLSDSGHYIAANSGVSGYIAYYDGVVGGLTNGAAQVASLGNVADQRAALLTQPGAYESVLLGDLNASEGGTELSAFGLYGSAAGGIRGTTSVGNATFNAGIMLGTGDYGTVAYDGALAAASLRYDLTAGESLTPFVAIGGSIGLLQNLTFRRSYANGAGTATGIGITDGLIASTFARLGAEADLSADDDLTLLAEIGQHWLSTTAYSEVQSAANPFPGTFSPALGASTSLEAAADWTHRFGDTADLTMRAAVGTTLGGTSSLVASVAGAPGQAVAPVGSLYVEAGLRLGWNVSASTRLDLYASGTTGERIGTAGHVGAGLSVGF